MDEASPKGCDDFVIFTLQRLVVFMESAGDRNKSYRYEHRHLVCFHGLKSEQTARQRSEEYNNENDSIRALLPNVGFWSAQRPHKIWN